MASHSIAIQSASIADHSTRAEVGSGIKIEGVPNRIYTLTAIDICIKSTMTTTVNSGGLVELENGSVDWKPTEIYSNLLDELTNTSGGGAAQHYKRIKCHKPLPVGSTVHVFYTASNAAIDQCSVVLHYIENEYDGKPQTFIKAGKGSALTQITTASSHITISIPASKGGMVKSILLLPVGTIEAGVVSGGLVQIHNKSVTPTIEPCEFMTSGVTLVVGGAAELEVDEIPVDIQCPANSDFKLDYTPTDNQSQFLEAMIKWE